MEATLYVHDLDPGDWVPESAETWRYAVLDVFADAPLEGNQLAVFDARGRALGDDLMQRTARELNLSETVFLFEPRSGGTASMRIFTPTAELPFAGHPVLGAAFSVAASGSTSEVVLETGVGNIRVELEREDGRPVFGWMDQPVPSWEPYEDEQALLEALGVEASGLTVEGYLNGPRHVFVELETEEDVASLTPDLRSLARLDIGANCFAGSGRNWKTRMFGPGMGVPEDPATGSAAGPLAVHLARNGRVAFGDEIVISQGTEIGRPSTLYARADGSGEHVDRVLVGGRAVFVANGEYRLS